MPERTADPRPPYVAVIGDGDPQGPDAHRLLEWAEEIGHELARAGATVVTGGLGGVMRAASRGAHAAGGVTIGILPGADQSEANEFVSIPIATGLGVARNLVVVTSADVVVAVGGRHGTLSEIGLALRMGRHVVALSSWRVESDQRLGGPRVHRVRNPREATALVLNLAKAGPGVLPDAGQVRMGGCSNCPLRQSFSACTGDSSLQPCGAALRGTRLRSLLRSAGSTFWPVLVPHLAQSSFLWHGVY